MVFKFSVPQIPPCPSHQSEKQLPLETLKKQRPKPAVRPGRLVGQGFGFSDARAQCWPSEYNIHVLHGTHTFGQNFHGLNKIALPYMDGNGLPASTNHRSRK